MVYKATFNLPNKNYYTEKVKGNGKTLGMWNGADYMGFGTAYAGSLFLGEGIYDQNANYGTTWSGQNRVGQFGVTPDSSKSGIIVETDSQLKLCIKY